MIDVDELFLVARLPYCEASLPLVSLSAGNRGIQMHREAPFNRFAYEPTRRRAQVSRNRSDAQGLRHRVKDQRNIRAHARTPTGAQA
jgi:hypothetical protein